MKPTLYILITICLFFLNCSNQKKSNSPYENAKTFSLLEIDKNIKLPASFKRTSRYRVKEDVSKLKEDTLALYLFQETLHSAEFIDAEVDIFADTTSEFHTVIILEQQRMQINKTTGSIIKKQLNDMYRSFEAHNSDITVVEVESNMSQNNIGSLLKYKHNLKNWNNGLDIYYNQFFYSNSNKSFMITEINMSIKDITKYIWSLK